MPSYLLTSPDGQQYRVSGDGTGEEALVHLQEQLGGNSPVPQQSSSFLGEMGQNVTNAVQSGGDILSGNFSSPGGKNLPSPRTQALADKLFPEGSQGTFMDAANNVGNTIPSDYSGALLEKFGQTLPGKTLSIIGGLNPVYNAASTAVNRYVNPALQKIGIAPENAQLMEMGVGTLGLKSAGKIADPTVAAIKSVGGKAIDAINTPKDVPLTSSDVGDLANRSYAAADSLGGALAPHAVDKFVNDVSSVAPQTSAGKAFVGSNPVTDTISDFQSLKGAPLSLKSMQEIDEDLSNRIDQQTDPIKGVNKVGYQLQQMQQKFRNTFLSAPNSDLIGGADGINAWREGQQLWATKIRMGDVERILNKAESADVPSTAIKNGLKTYVNKPANKRGWSDDEWSMLQSGAKTGLVTGALKTLGSKLISGVAGAAGGAGGGIPGSLFGAAVGEAVGYPMRLGATALQKKAPMAALNSLSNRSVINQAGNVAPSVTKLSAPLTPPTATGSLIGASATPQINVQTPPVTLPGASALNTMTVPALPAAKAPINIFGGSTQKTIGGNEGQDTFQSPDQVKDTLDKVSQQTGVDSDLLHGIAKVESSMNPNAKAPTSTASGLMQITQPTWKALVMKYGKQYGFGMQDIMNPQANATAGALLASDNAQKLSDKLGREPDNAELYMAHFLGANKAVKLLNASPRDIAAQVLPSEAYANKSVFYYADGKPRDIYAVRMLLSNKINNAVNQSRDARMKADQTAQLRDQNQSTLQAMASKIPAESIQALRSNPQLAGDFNQMYGSGSADLFLS